MTTSRAGRSRVPTRDVAASATGAAVFSLSLAISSVALPLLALRAGYSAAEIGVLTAVSAVAQVTARMGLGVVMRRWPDRNLIAVAGVLLALSNGTAAASAALLPFVLAQLLQGASRACFWTGTQTHVVRGPGRAAGALATVNLVASTGSLAGPAVAGILAERTPVLALAVASGVAVMSVLPTFFLDRLPPFTPPDDRPPGRLWRRPGVDLGCWAGVSAGAWRGLLNSFVPVVLDAARQSASTIGALISVAHGATLLGSALAVRVRPRWSRRVVLGGIVVTGGTTALLAAVASSVAASAVALAVSGLTVGLLQVLGVAVALESVHPEERGEAIAVTGSFRAAALLAAPLAGAGLVVVLPLVPAIAAVGAAMTLPAIALLTGRRRLARAAAGDPRA